MKNDTPQELTLAQALVADESFVYLGQFNQSRPPIIETDEEIEENAGLLLSDDTQEEVRTAILQDAFALMQGLLQEALRISDEAARTALLKQAEGYARKYMFEIFRHSVKGRNAMCVALAVHAGREIEFECCADPTERQARTVGRFVGEAQTFVCETYE